MAALEPDQGRILTINGGSSSIKFALFSTGIPPRRVLGGSISRIGQSSARLQVFWKESRESLSQDVAAEDHEAAVNVLMDWIVTRLGHGVFAAIGHRIVHGGPEYTEAQRIDDKLIKAVQAITPFDPEHLPEEILLAGAFRRRFPEIPQVACFDTAFHRHLPRISKILPIPRRYLAQGVHRYGFHGLSYAFLMEELSRSAGKQAASGRIILAHLGNGASLAAVFEGKVVDTSMGFTPTAGVPMGTRSGDIDPGLVWYLAQTENMTFQQFNQMVNFESGLLGISETSSDMQDLLDYETADPRAAEAVALFCYQIRKQIGAFAAALGGVDTLVFSGGIGENAAVVRTRICEGLGFLGIHIDEGANSSSRKLISRSDAPVAVRVIPTDEECMIATIVCRVLQLA